MHRHNLIVPIRYFSFFLHKGYDPDAPTVSGFWHWVVYDIPPTVTSLPTNAGSPDAANLPYGVKMLKNDAGFAGFLGAGTYSYLSKWYSQSLA